MYVVLDFKMAHQWTDFLFGNETREINFQYLYGVDCG